jgi:predicted phosphodiesterase
MESVVRLAFVSDIHGNLAALEAVIADLEQRQVDQVVNLGDTLSGPLLPQETAQRLRALPWRHVAGNHERQVLSLPLHRQNPSDAYTSAQLSPENRDWIQTHAAPCASDLHQGQRWADRLGTDVALCHGSPRSDIEYLLETPVGQEARLATEEEIEERLDGRVAARIGLLACGHSHVARAVRLASGLLILNPGSVGLAAYDDDHPYPQSSYHRIETGSPDARYAIAEKVSGSWSCQLLSVPYDHEAMAQLADQRGRPDWARALRTGRMPRRAK